MRKAIVAVIAVAILGVLTLYTNKPSDSTSPATLGSNNSTTTASSSQPSSDSATSSSASTYHDGTFDGGTASTIYGSVHVAVTISSGKITDVKFIQMPNDRGHTREVTAFSQPLLKSETLKHQSADIDFVSGATQTSEGYQQSLQAALDKASGSALLQSSSDLS